MSVDTKSIVLSKELSIEKFSSTIYNSLKKLIHSKIDKNLSLKERLNSQIWRIDNTINFSSDMKMATISFKYNNENRTLYLFNNLSDRYQPLDNEDPKYIWSLGSWGSHVEIMNHLNDDMRKVTNNDIFYIKEDCNEDWVKV